MGLKYYIVDVFAQERFTGNPVAIVECNQELSDEKMLQIARELNAPETTFVNPVPQDGCYKIRMFTPTREVMFSGHPTLGAAFIINHFFASSPKKQVKLSLKSSEVLIDSPTLEDGAKNTIISKHKPILFSGQKSPEFDRKFDPVLISRIVGVDVEDFDDRYPIQAVTVGLGFVIVPIKTLHTLKRIRINQERYSWFCAKSEAKLILAFTPETVDSENHLHVRVFSDFYGIPEDPATGSGNGALVAYLSKYNFFDSPEIDVRIEQGYEIGRPSLILAKAVPRGEEIDVTIGGRVILVAQGEIF
jgi:trans-2,3-dihydro-3-hydroxyanthranilate isomerase